MEDELIKISAVLLYPDINSSGDKALENTSKTEINCGYNCPSTVYICELSEVKGKFDPEKALAKGLKPGYKYGKLQKGESVVADDGITMVRIFFCPS
jgi:ribonuclease Z